LTFIGSVLLYIGGLAGSRSVFFWHNFCSGNFSGLCGWFCGSLNDWNYFFRSRGISYCALFSL
jgi:hypothetical protein